MYILVPELRERIWGTPRLKHYISSASAKVGSIYSLSGIPEIDCKVRDQEVTLNQLIQENPSKFGLPLGAVYPLIISFTACDEDLSIQVHPTDQVAREKEGMPYGKSEAWYFLEAPEKKWIYAEQRIADKKSLVQAIAQGSYSRLLKEYPVSREDLIYIPSGTIHALTKGALVYEIQQATDITYRFYDYDRTDEFGKKRQLHVKRVVETLQPMQKVTKTTFKLGEEVQLREFTIKHLVVEQTLKNSADVASVVTIVNGELKIAGSVCQSGQSILLLPHECISIIGKAEAIIATPHIYWSS